MTANWFVLGFTADEIVSGRQDGRLAQECLAAWQSAGWPTSFEIMQATGDGELIVKWFVNVEAALVLDAHGVHWRGRICGEQPAPPADATSLLRWSVA
jgi:hypothetical protein